MIETRDEKYQRQTKESFEHLGRFVQEFEQMVFTIRVGIRDVLAGNSRDREGLLDVVLNHEALSAKPLSDMFRGIIATAMQHPTYTDEQRAMVRQILKQIAREFQDLTEQRNKILHGTWFIGWASAADEDFSQMSSMKWKVTAEGAKPVDDVPKSVEDLKALISRCTETKRTITALLFSLRLPQMAGGLEKNFTRVGKGWVAISSWK